MLRRKSKSRGSRRIQLDDASAESYVRGLVEAAAAIRLPALFAKPHPNALLSVAKVHGFGVFNRLPILPDLPVQQIRELGRFVKNQRYHGVEDKSIRGPVEVGVAIFRMIAETLSFELSAVVGDLEEAVAKQNLDFFHVPLVVVHGTMPLQGEDSWLFPRYLRRTVFPFALLASDAAGAVPRLDAIEK